MTLDSKDKLDAIFSLELKYLMAVSYVVLCNNMVTDRYIVKNFGMPVQAWSSLFAIEIFPGIKAKEIRKLFPRPQNTISRAISLLETRGLVRQVASRDDGREKMIYITPAGQDVLAEIRRVSSDRQSEIFAPLNKQELETYFRFTDKIARGQALNNSTVMV